MNRTAAWKIAVAVLLAGTVPGIGAALGQGPVKKTAAAAALTEAEKSAFFAAQVRPLLQENCVVCHGGDSPSGGLNLLSREAILKGGVSGPSVVLNKPAGDSLLVRAINHVGRKMPPQGKLPKAQIDTLTRWVSLGLPWSEAEKAADAAAPVHHGPPPVNAQTKRFWSFRPVKRPAVPKVKNAAWVTNAVDAFVLAKLEKNNLAPAPPAGKATLLRRLYYDLTGLPSAPATVKAFLADKSPDAYAKVVDKLLASPQYGERWGRHWLDIVRYAESNSFERDDPKPFVWRYRDYVINAFNSDKPYDQFLREQLAGDELDNVTPETLIATGYYRLGAWDDEPSDPEQARYDDLDDIASTTGQAMLGLTVGCARCHDHKLDPIPQKDYYKFLAFFQNVNRYGVRGGDSVARSSLRPISPAAEIARFTTENDAYKARLADVDAQIKAVEDVVRPDFQPVEKEEFQDEGKRPAIVQKRVPRLLSQETFDRYVSLTKQRDDLRKSPPRGLEQAMCVTEAGRVAPPTFVLGRGSAHAPGDEVQPGFLSVLSPPAPALREPPAEAKSSYRRRALADWVASDKNPLAARVIVNRVWQFHFGRGIVRSSNNFGRLGNLPTHPELLDYLASDFVKNGWRLKRLHRMILLSSVYQMSSEGSKKALARDPENDLFWRFDMRRLEAEEVRDSLLAVNNTLNPKMFGPSIYPTLPPEVLAGQSVPGHNWNTSPKEEQARRSVYVHIKRSVAVPLLASFDAADTDASCPVRFATTQPTQALGLLNSTFVNEQAHLFAASLKKQAGSAPAAQVRLALWRVLQRAPTDKEIARGVSLIADIKKKDAASADDALAAFCVVALNLNEFLYLD